MKTFTTVKLSLSILALGLLISTNFTSCKKADISSEELTQAKANGSPSSFAPLEMATTASTSTTPSGTAANATVSFCSEKVVPLCSSGTVVGSMTVKRGTDDKYYFTYSASPGWYLVQVNTFAGLLSQMPNYLADFPNKKLLSYPFTSTEYSFTLGALPESFTVAGYAILVKKTNGIISGIKIAWADGCNGNPITCNPDATDRTAASTTASRTDCGCSTDLEDGVTFNYTSSNCAMSLAIEEPVDICSRPIPTFFGIHPVYNVVTAWPVPTVTVGGYTYTEAEGRAIANCVDLNNVQKDSKFAFQRVATLKLSKTDYAQSSLLPNAVATIENWLATTGKLSPSNLPTGNGSVKSAASIIDAWINNHTCPERR